MNSSTEQAYWSKRYQEGQTGWDIGYIATPLKEYIDQLTDKGISILIPGAGNAYEAEYLWKKGFRNVIIMDISEIPLQQFAERNPDLPAEHLKHENFFEHRGQYDLILEQTFFCSMVPTDKNRNAYARQMANLLKPHGKLVGVWFDIPLTSDMVNRPFGGNRQLYVKYLRPYFNTVTFEPCHNSIQPRRGIELFGIFEKK